MGRRRIETSHYISRARHLNIRPNFWLSSTYFYHAKWSVFSIDNWLHVKDEEGFDMLPPLPEHEIRSFTEKFQRETFYHTDYVWALFPGMQVNVPEDRKGNLEGLDYNFIFEPRNFNKMEGGDWSTFRKNSRKFPNRWENKIISSIEYLPYPGVIEERMRLLEEWAVSLGPDTPIHDDETLLNYAQDPYAYSQVLRDSVTGEALAINIFDENHRYINFRYCLCRPLPFLSEYARLQFYLQGPCEVRWVNDGGYLDNEKLKTFKSKMNPKEVHPIFTFNVKK